MHIHVHVNTMLPYSLNPLYSVMLHVYVSVIIFRKCNMTWNLYVDVMSLLKQVITTIFYIIVIKIEFIIMSDRYYVSCHVKVLHVGNFLREKLLLHILL